MGRILAIDYGRKRCGVAVTDTLQLIANGLTTIPTAQLMPFFEDYFAKEQVDIVVFGLPKQMDNTESQSMQYIKPFVKKFQQKFPDKKVEFEDERFTSKIAFQTMIDGGLKKKERQHSLLRAIHLSLAYVTLHSP